MIDIISVYILNYFISLDTPLSGILILLTKRSIIPYVETTRCSAQNKGPDVKKTVNQANRSGTMHETPRKAACFVIAVSGTIRFHTITSGLGVIA